MTDHQDVIRRDLRHRLLADRRIDPDAVERILKIADNELRVSLTPNGWGVRESDIEKFVQSTLSRPGFQAAPPTPVEPPTIKKEHNYRVTRWTPGEFAKLSPLERLNLANRGGVRRDDDGSYCLYERTQ